MKNVLLATLLAAVVGLTGCGSDKPANNITTPKPEDSGVTGPPPKEGKGGRVPTAPDDKKK